MGTRVGGSEGALVGGFVGELGMLGDFVGEPVGLFVGAGVMGEFVGCRMKQK